MTLLMIKRYIYTQITLQTYVYSTNFHTKWFFVILLNNKGVLSRKPFKISENVNVTLI